MYNNGSCNCMFVPIDIHTYQHTCIYARTCIYAHTCIHTQTPQQHMYQHMTPQRLCTMTFQHHVRDRMHTTLGSHMHCVVVRTWPHASGVRLYASSSSSCAVCCAACTYIGCAVVSNDTRAFACVYMPHASRTRVCACVHACIYAYVSIDVLFVAMCGHAPCCLTMQPWHCA